MPVGTAFFICLLAWLLIDFSLQTYDIFPTLMVTFHNWMWGQYYYFNFFTFAYLLADCKYTLVYRHKNFQHYNRIVTFHNWMWGQYYYFNFLLIRLLAWLLIYFSLQAYNIETDQQNLWLTFGRFTTISSLFGQLNKYLSQNWGSDGHFELLNRSKSWLV